MKVVDLQVADLLPLCKVLIAVVAVGVVIAHLVLEVFEAVGFLLLRWFMKRCPYCKVVVRTEEDLREHLADCDLAQQSAAENEGELKEGEEVQEERSVQ